MTFDGKVKKETKKQKKMTFRKWWNKSGYKVMHVVLFPIWVFILWNIKREEKTHKSLVFTKETCKQYLDKVMPKMVARHNEGHDEILISNCDDMGGIRFADLWNCNNKKMSYFFSHFYPEVERYIIQEYTIEGYEKMVLDNWTLWNEAKKMFDWYNIPWNANYAKGVLFYKKK